MTAASTNWGETRRARQATNLLGALVLALSDRLEDSIVDASGGPKNGAVVLSALNEFLDAPRLDLVAQVLGLTSSGTVRLVDRLESEGYVRRSTGEDARTTRLTLTGTGRRRAKAVGAGRVAVMEEALASLSADERLQFGRLAGKILAGLIREPGATRWTCRLCDIGLCGRPEGRCPVYEAAKARYGEAG